jgi:rare lipoprotein A
VRLARNFLLLGAVLALLALAQEARAAPEAAAPEAAARPHEAAELGIASWYGADFHGRKTANGEVYDKEKLTCAHRTLSFGTFLRVRNLDNGSSVVVRVNDRGPFAKNRVIDLSEAAARIVGMIPTGTARVSLTAIPEEEALAWEGGSLDGTRAPALRAAPEGPAASPDAKVRIQVASYASEANAKATAGRLALSGLSARIERSGARFRVVLSDLSRDEARVAAQRLEGLGYRGYTITITGPVLGR